MSPKKSTATNAERPVAPLNAGQERFPTFSKAWQQAKSEMFPSFLRLGRAAGRRWKRSRRWVFRGALALLLAYIGLNLYASLLLNRELAEIRAKGEPLQVTELSPPRVPDAQNAALVYQHAYQAMQITPEKAAPLWRTLLSGRPFSPSEMAWMRKRRGAVALVRRAIAMPACRFPVDWNTSDVLNVHLSYQRQQRELCFLLAMQASIEAQLGQTDAALADIRGIYIMGSQLQSEPTLIGFLVARAIDYTGNQALARVLAQSPLPAARGRAFLKSLPRRDWDAVAHRSLIGERTFGIWVYSNAQAALSSPRWDDNSGGLRHSVWSYPLALAYKPLLKLDEVYTLRLWKQLLNDTSNASSASFAKSIDQKVSGAPFYAVLTRTLFPAVDVFVRQSRDVSAGQRQRKIALALSAFRAARGRYPDTLDQTAAWWGAPLPLDPYNNHPFHYVNEGRTFGLYSVGANGVDEKGASRYGGGIGNSPRNLDADDMMWGARRDPGYRIYLAPNANVVGQSGAPAKGITKGAAR